MAASLCTRNFTRLCLHRQRNATTSDNFFCRIFITGKPSTNTQDGLSKQRHLPSLCKITKDVSASLHSSSVYGAGAKWREEQGLPLTGNEYGPLTDTPDWCYADGRPAPPSKGSLRRKEQQRDLAMKIDQLAQEVLDARENYQKQIKETEDQELDRQRRELRSKGVLASKYKQSSRRNRRTGSGHEEKGTL